MTQMHTPGPWRVFDVFKDLEIVTDRPTAHETESLVQFKGQANAVANARLMALAPEMFDALEICEDALAELSRLDDGTCSTAALIAARAILAKARPRPKTITTTNQGRTHHA
jgi:hypothetical protein